MKGIARPVIFGLSDGAMSILGVVYYATGHDSRSVFWVALSGGLTASLSMAGGEWLSDSDSGPAAAALMGASTLGGSVLPAIPYLFLHGAVAPFVSALALIPVAVVVARLRLHRKHPYAETGAVLGVIVVASILCLLVLPGGTP